MDQIYKTDLNELFSYQRKGEKLEEKEKVIEIEIERLRDFKEHTKPMCRIGQSSCISISMTAWIRSERRGRG